MIFHVITDGACSHIFLVKIGGLIDKAEIFMPGVPAKRRKLMTDIEIVCTSIRKCCLKNTMQIICLSGNRNMLMIEQIFNITSKMGEQTIFAPGNGFLCFIEDKPVGRNSILKNVHGESRNSCDISWKEKRSRTVTERLIGLVLCKRIDVINIWFFI